MYNYIYYAHIEEYRSRVEIWALRTGVETNMATIVKETDGKYTTETECYGGEIDVMEHETKEDAEKYAEVCNFFFK